MMTKVAMSIVVAGLGLLTAAPVSGAILGINYVVPQGNSSFPDLTPYDAFTANVAASGSKIRMWDNFSFPSGSYVYVEKHYTRDTGDTSAYQVEMSSGWYGNAPVSLAYSLDGGAWVQSPGQFDGDWTVTTMTFTVPADVNELAVRRLAGPAYFDNTNIQSWSDTFTVVPEPASLAILAVAASALVARRRHG